jgi:LPS sulfotransferase NodH
MLQRFVFLTHARSGSTLVSQALGSHPAVVMCDELFHADPEERKGQITDPARVLQPLQDWYRDGDDPVQFLENQLYDRSWPVEKKAAGFKLFHPHARTGTAAQLWDWLIAAKDIRIINSFRQELLAAYVSRARARKTGLWEKPVGDQHTAHIPPFPVDIVDFKQYVDELTGYRDRTVAQLADHPCISFEYATDIRDHFDETMQRIQEFLGLEPAALPQRLSKQASVPLSERITNYDALRDALQGSKYEAYV